MINVYVFNPEHDIALAANLKNFTAPHAGRTLRHDLGFLPALWAERGSMVLVDNVEAAKAGLRKLGLFTGAKLVDSTTINRTLKNVTDDIKISPWGWDIAIRQSIRRIGIPLLCYLPDNVRLNRIRRASHRAWAASHLLPSLQVAGKTTGVAKEAHSIEDIRSFFAETHSLVLKAPWSSSGRGIRYVLNQQDVTPQLNGWINNIIGRQGSVMMEPYYNKVIDFGMEFTSDAQGNVRYEGLSLFDTINGAYTGNLIADEEYKTKQISHYTSPQLIEKIKQLAITSLSKGLKGTYAGPLGIDMMIVNAGNKLYVHPCVELNLRMTMGHVAILLNKMHHIENKIMRIAYSNGHYSFRII